MARGLYQNLGGDYPAENANRADSRFWNRGRWDNFIQPLLLAEGVALDERHGVTDGKAPHHVFIEIGCNAGLFLQAATSYGFGRVIGLEKSGHAVKHGRRYRDEHNLEYELRNGTFGLDVSLDDFPVCDVLLLSTVHYYFSIQEWTRMLDILHTRARYVIFVSRHMLLDHNRPQSGMRDLCDYFPNDRWRKVATVTDVPKVNDPKARHDLFSVMFQSRVLKREPINRFMVGDEDQMNVGLSELVVLAVINDEDINITETKYYKELLRRKAGRWSPPAIVDFVGHKVAMMRDVKERGLMEPLLAHPSDHWRSRHLVDGGHRLMILHALGHTTVLVREVGP